jgi:hypothetical protein
MKRVWLAPVLGTVFVVAAGALGPVGAAFACKGTTTLLRDDFTEEDPAWDIKEEKAQVGNGAFKMTSEAGRINLQIYGGMVFPGGDACVDVVLPAGRPSNDVRGGLGLWVGRQWNFIYLASDGTAGVEGLQNGTWTAPVPNRKVEGLKSGPEASNQLRVVWKSPPRSNSADAPDSIVAVFINDKPFIRFKAAPNANRQIAFYVASNGGVFQFKNLHVTE